MRLLLDTHTFLWAVSEPQKLPTKSREAIRDESNLAFVSAVCLWEITIKVRIGKLELGWEDDLITAALNAGIEPLPLTPDEAATYGDLTESSHNDPFDRMIIWQAIRRNMTLISRDPEFERFRSLGLKLLWK